MSLDMNDIPARHGVLIISILWRQMNIYCFWYLYVYIQLLKTPTSTIQVGPTDV
jgi:hypothetical protein